MESVNPERPSQVPAPARPRDYFSFLSKVIDDTHQDSAQLRALVYELARFNLKREALFGYQPMSMEELTQHLNELELAIARIEANAPAGDSKLAFPIQSAGIAPSNSVMIMPGEAIPPLYEGPASQPIDEMPRLPSGFRLGRAIRIVAQLAAAAATVVILYAAFTGQLHFGDKPKAAAPAAMSAPAPSAAKTNAADKTETGKLPAEPISSPSYPIPSNYGVYALSNNLLNELDALPGKVPDARVPLSPEITKPIKTIVPSGKLAFILFRRDLVNNAPDKLVIRVVAKVARELKFVQGKATTAKIEGVWRIRSNSYELKVSPVPGSREMIIAQAEPEITLPAGRYALVINGQGYDFTVAGPITASVQCLERFETANGDNFTECRL